MPHTPVSAENSACSAVREPERKRSFTPGMSSLCEASAVVQSLHEHLASIQVRSRVCLLHAAVSALRSANEASFDVRLEPDVHRAAHAGITGLQALNAAYQIGAFLVAQLRIRSRRRATPDEQ
jgi:hypothetical protein